MNSTFNIQCKENTQKSTIEKLKALRNKICSTYLTITMYDKDKKKNTDQMRQKKDKKKNTDQMRLMRRTGKYRRET